MAPSHLSHSSKPLSGWYLTFAEREEIALWRARGLSVREIARHLGRAASTISRELRRNAATRGGNLDYRATTAQWHAERAARRPKGAKLATSAALRAYVGERLAGTVVRSRRRCGAWAGRALEGAPARASAVPALGEGVESAADR
jgi:transposase